MDIATSVIFAANTSAFYPGNDPLLKQEPPINKFIPNENQSIT